ncbi:MAG: branched-chain amino acid ABC transporter permease [Thermodesulfobacteriota bacterium]
MRRASRPRFLWLGLLGLGLLSAPHVLGDYHRYILTEILMWGLFALGFDIIFGKTGLLNFGMSSFFGLGGYGLVWAVHHFGANIWLGLLAAMVLTMAFSCLLGMLVTRFGSHYFVVFSIIASTILFLLAMNQRWLTGADEGINIRLKKVPMIFADLSLNDPLVKYYLVLGITALAFWAILRFFDSPVGRAIESIKHNEKRAEMLGYDTRVLKLIAFTLSGTVAGLAGGLYPVLNSNANAGLFFWLLSGNAILWTVVGGAGTLWGCFLGTSILVLVEDTLSSWMVDLYPILIGVLLILVIILAPKGILGSLQDHLRKKSGH